VREMSIETAMRWTLLGGISDLRNEPEHRFD
jgi:hypothetical protein